MRALQLDAVHQLSLKEVADPKAAPGEAVVTIRSASLNHRDVWIKKGEYAGLKFPCIPGSDGAGIVSEVGEGVDTGWVGKEVVIYPGSKWGPTEAAQGKDFSILGLPADGTLADKVKIPAEQLTRKPAHLTFDQAACLPVAGVTAYRAVFSRCQLKAGETVLISGVGGGAALFALQYALAAGAKVWVTSSSESKIAKAVSLGAKGGFLYTQPEWWKEAQAKAGGFDVTIDSAGGEGFDALVEAANPGGRIAFFGATRGNLKGLALRKVFWRQLSLLGTTMGSPKDWAEQLAFISKHQIVPVISDTFDAKDGLRAFEWMERGGQMGKIVVQFSR